MPDIFESLIPTGEDPTIDVTKNYLEELVGEGKKYSDPEQLARAAMEKELHIRKIERENAALRQTSAAQQKLEELVTKLASTQEKSPSNDGVDTSRERDVKVQTPEEIEETITSVIAKRDAEARQAKNVRVAGEALLKQFGPNYAVHLNTVAGQLGMQRSDLDALAARSPEAFLRLVGVGSKIADQTLSPPRSAVSTQSTQTAAKGEKTRSYYQKMLKEDRDRFLSPSIQNEMHDQAFKLGDAFNDVA